MPLKLWLTPLSYSTERGSSRRTLLRRLGVGNSAIGACPPVEGGCSVAVSGLAWRARAQYVSTMSAPARMMDVTVSAMARSRSNNRDEPRPRPSRIRPATWWRPRGRGPTGGHRRETIKSRTNRWDVSTAVSADARAAESNARRRAELLAEGRALLDGQVGLAEVKRAVAELEDQIDVRALRLAHGLPVANQTNHMLLVGHREPGKTTTAEALGKIFAGLGIVRHPEIVDVKRADFCGNTSAHRGPRQTN